MKRSPAIASLSREHHQALFVAQELRRATDETAGEARGAALAYWDEHGKKHFRLEEEVLLPAYAAYGDPPHRLVARVLCDHVSLRGRFDRLALNRPASVTALRELGVELAAHVRLEERELFPLIEETLPAADLAAVAAALEQAEHS
jgi:hemerythrin-like domain-containing protein